MKPAGWGSTLAVLLACIVTAQGTLWGGTNVWTSIGPDGGNAHALAIDPQNPNIVYASTSGGVFKSVNGGANWSAANSGLPAGYFARSLAIDPRNPSTVYAGGSCTVLGSCGIFKSTDGGTNWSPANSGLDGAVILVESLAIDPQNPSTVYAGTTACFQSSGSPGWVEGNENLCWRPGVFKTTNGGASWSSANSGLPWASVDFGFVTALAIDPQDPSTVYAGTVSGVFKTTNGGISWSAAKSGAPCCYTALVIDPNNPSTVYAGTFVGVFKTTNGGTAWSAVNSGLSPVCCGSLAIDPQDPNTVYAGGSDAVFKSTDGGTSWAKTGLPSFSDTSFTIAYQNPSAGLAIDPQNPSTVYAATSGLGVFKSTDRASTWSAVDSGLSATAIQSSAVDPQNPAAIYAATNAGVFKTTNGGVSWSSANSGLPARANAPDSMVTAVPVSLAIDAQDSRTLFAGIRGPLGSQEAGIFRSTDGGANWISVSSALAPGYFLAALAIDPQTPSTVYAGGFNPSTFGFVSEILKSTDWGTNWSPIGSFPSPVWALVIDSQSPSNLYAVDGGIFKSTDGGASWRDLSVPTDSVGDCDECLPVGVLAVDPQRPDTLYAGGSVGVLKSTDGGTSWNAANSGLPPLPDAYGVRSLVIDPQNSTTLYAAMAGKAFRSTDGAATWSEVTSGLTTLSVTALAIDPSNSTVYAATYGGGMFAITFAP